MLYFNNIPMFPRRGSRTGLLPCAGRLAACLLAGLLLSSCGWASSAEDPSEGLILHGFATRNGGSRGYAIELDGPDRYARALDRVLQLASAPAAAPEPDTRTAEQKAEDEAYGNIANKSSLAEVDALLRSVADVNAVYRDGSTPLHRAARSASPDVVRLLIDRGAHVNAVDRAGATPLHEAAAYDWATEGGRGDVVRLLLDRGARVNAVDRAGATPLHRAAQSASVDVMCLLIAKGARVNATDKDGVTPLYTVVDEERPEAVRALLERGADANIGDGDGITPLLVAVGLGNEPLAKLLLQHGARVNAAHERKWTPLHVAAYNGRLGLIPLLLSAGADPDAETVDGKTPLDLAEAVAENDALPGATRQLAASCAKLLRKAMAERKR